MSCCDDTMIEIDVLGGLSVRKDGEPVELPQSRRTRALLAYLAMTGRPHRREHLCWLLWDDTRDPRGALRWSLSRLRRGLKDERGCVLHADRDRVWLDMERVCLDLDEVRLALAIGVDHLSIDELEALASRFAGELLEGQDVSDAEAFEAFCVAERVRAEEAHVSVLRGLVKRLPPASALAYAQRLVQLDPYHEHDRATLVELLVQLRRKREASFQLRVGHRRLRELGLASSGALSAAMAAG